MLTLCKRENEIFLISYENDSIRLFLQPFLDSKIRLNDICGVNNLHGMPGLMGAIVGIIASALATKSAYGETK